MGSDSNASGHEPTAEPGDSTTSDNPSRLGRRSFVKLAGASLASIGAASAWSSSSDAAEYETITVAPGTVETIEVGDGETFENTLIDMTADGASAKILTSGSDWTIRNVGFEGEHPGGNYLMIPGVADPDGHGLVENVYMGDGQPDGSLKGSLWVNANMPHRGTITFRNFHMAQLINGLYASGPGVTGAGGNVQVENSYFYSNSVANIRTNGKKRPNLIKDTVVDIDDTRPALGSDTTAPGSKVTRAIWSWYGECHLENCDIVGELATSEGGTITQTNTRLGDQADTTPPDGVPMSAEEAASGSSSADSTAPDDSADDESESTTDGGDTEAPSKFVVIDGSGSKRASRYSFEVVDGSVEKDGERGSINSFDTIEDGTVTGRVIGGKDAYRYTGSMRKFRIDGSADVRFGNDE